MIEIERWLRSVWASIFLDKCLHNIISLCESLSIPAFLTRRYRAIRAYSSSPECQPIWEMPIATLKKNTLALGMSPKTLLSLKTVTCLCIHIFVFVSPKGSRAKLSLSRTAFEIWLPPIAHSYLAVSLTPKPKKWLSHTPSCWIKYESPKRVLFDISLSFMIQTLALT